MLVVPMVHEERRPRRDRGRPRSVGTGSMHDDETDADDLRRGTRRRRWSTPSNVDRLHRQQAELEHQLDGQRRLLGVNERLLSTLEPAGVLDLIADSLKAIVPVRLADHLPRRPGRGRPPGRSSPATRSPTRSSPDETPARRRAHRLGDRARRSRPGQRGPPRRALGPGPGHAVRARGDDRRAAAGQGRRRSARSTSGGWATRGAASARTSSS